MDLLQSLLDRVRNFLRVDLADDIEAVIGHRVPGMPLLCWIVTLEEAKQLFFAASRRRVHQSLSPSRTHEGNRRSVPWGRTIQTMNAAWFRRSFRPVRKICKSWPLF